VFDNSNLEPFRVQVLNNETNLSAISNISTASFFINAHPFFTTPIISANLYAIRYIEDGQTENVTSTGSLDISGIDPDGSTSNITITSLNIASIPGITGVSTGGKVSGTLSSVNTEVTYSYQAKIEDVNFRI